MVEVIVGPIVHHHALCEGSGPDVEVEGEQRDRLAAGPVADKVFAHLSVIIRQAVGIRLGFREQQQAAIFVGLGGKHDGLGGLEVFLTVLDILNTGHLAVVVGQDASDVGALKNREILRFLRSGNGVERGRILGADGASAGIAKAVVNASRRPR